MVMGPHLGVRLNSMAIKSSTTPRRNGDLKLILPNPKQQTIQIAELHFLNKGV